jgi:hypothetical protein
MKKKRVKRWVTKYALTQGIFLVAGEGYEDGGFFYKPTGPSQWSVYVGRNSNFATREEAVDAAKVMALKKIQSLEKQIAALREKEF